MLSRLKYLESSLEPLLLPRECSFDYPQTMEKATDSQPRRILRIYLQPTIYVGEQADLSRCALRKEIWHREMHI